MTISFPHTVPLTIKEESKVSSSSGSAAQAAQASGALCRYTADVPQENHGRTTPSAAAMEKSNHPTDLLWCLFLSSAAANRGKPC